MERPGVRGRVIDFLKRKEQGKSALPQVPKIEPRTDGPIDFTQLRINSARAILQGSVLSKRQRSAIEELVAGERERAHVQTNLSWQVALASPESGLDLDDAEIGQIRDIQEELYEVTSTMGVTYTNLEELDGRRDLD